MDSPVLNTLSLFSGYGGLDLGFAAAVRELGLECRVVAYAERETYLLEVLVARMESGDLDPAPVWSDVATLDGRPFRGLVDCIIGGFPCQDISVAGNQAGLDGARSGLWWDMLRIVGEVRPRVVAIENVTGMLADRVMESVVGGLASLGYVGSWRTLRACDVGLPHQRERVFVVAVLADADRGRCEGERVEERARVEGEPRRIVDRRGDDRRLDGPERRTDVPPGPDDADGWRAILELRPDLAPAIESEVRRVADGTPHRLDRLRALGNGVIPRQAAAAFGELFRRLV